MEKGHLNTVGQRVRSARINAGFVSAANLAQAVTELSSRYISQQSIQKLESDISSSSWAIVFIAELTNKSAYWLVTGSVSENPLSIFENLTPENQERVTESARAYRALEQQKDQ